MSNFQIFDFTSDLSASSNKTTNHNIHDELIVMMQKRQSEMDNDFKEMQAKWANFFNNYRTSAIISNDEHQEQQNQDHDTATRIQRIIREFINCRQQHFVRTQQYQDATTKFQSLI